MKEFAILMCLIFVFSVCVFSGITTIKREIESVYSSFTEMTDSPTVVLDAGHGGEDGGAVAYDGTLEKDLNLKMTEKIAFLFDLFGIRYSSIRTEDISVGDTTLDTIRARKASDIYKREAIINSFENPIFLSIHMNKFEVEKYSGTQVFFGPVNSKSEVLANCIQMSVKNSIQQDNSRKIKAATDDIYLLYNASAVAVMVECGFLSNMTELELLKDSSYQMQLSYFIVNGLINYMNIKE